MMATDKGDVPSERLTDQPPSCIEFCPANPSIFVVGTYKLETHQESHDSDGTQSQSRSGRVELYQVKKGAHSSGFGVSQCKDKYGLPNCAVLDLHFRPQDPTLFAVCTSTSQMVFFRLENVESKGEADSARPSMRKLGSCKMGGDDTVLATAFTWEARPDTHLLSLAVAFSSGDVKLFGVSEYDFQIELEGSIDPAHTLEAWTVAFVGLSSHVEKEKMLLTGGDDSILTFHSIKSETDSDRAIAIQLFQDRKSHTAGVTAVLPIFEVSHAQLGTRVFVTGSYDEHIRVFTLEVCPPYRRNVVAELSLGGGVWRLRTLSQLPCEEVGGDHVCCVLLLACCMHAGIRIVRIVRKLPKDMKRESCTWEIDVIGAFTKGHESVCYGADSVSVRSLIDHEAEYPGDTDPLLSSDNPDNDDDPPKDFIVVSTSFYDKKICVWSYHYDDTPIRKVNVELDSINAHLDND